MRVYAPVSWAQLATLHTDGVLREPLPARAVSAAAARDGDGPLDQEQDEYDAQIAAAQRLPASEAGVVLALDVAGPAVPADGWVTLTGPVARGDVAAVFTGDLAWYGVQEIDSLLAGR